MPHSGGRSQSSLDELEPEKSKSELMQIGVVNLPSKERGWGVTVLRTTRPMVVRIPSPVIKNARVVMGRGT